MKAISLWQPWASCIAFGAKRIETRSWKTSYRGPLAIHAGKRKVKSEWELIESLDFFQAVFWDPTGQCYPIGDNLPFGALVAVVDLVDCIPTTVLKKERRTVELRRQPGAPKMAFWSDFDLGDYRDGRYGWIFENLRPLEEPIPYRGEQGLFEVPDELVLGGLS